ncbi:MAG: cytochrome-c peroxidase [Gammaproteobacteria bacterium]
MKLYLSRPRYWILFLVVCCIFVSSTTILIASSNNEEINKEAIFGPGDRKHGYDQETYVTNSLSVTARKGKLANLLQFVDQAPLGLPKMQIPTGNPITEEKISLGRRLFFDRRLSLNDTFSCAICHIPEQGYANNELATAIGFEGRSVKRNSPTIYNVGYYDVFFHDAREDSLEQQVWAPLLARNEMANPSIGYVINKIKGIEEYKGLFETAFDGKGPTMETVGEALAAYQRTLNSGNSRFDQWYYGKKEDALNDDEKAGFALFVGKGKCSACHLVNEEYALFTDQLLHNTGHGYNVSMGVKPEKIRVQLAPGVFVNVDNDIIDSVRQTPKQNDVGLYTITQNPFDRWKFRTPILRNVALTAPYMHDGAFTSLRQVVEFYNKGGIPNELLSPLLSPLNLTEQEMDQLVSFMLALTGDNIEVLVADGFAAPIGDIRSQDPNWAHDSEFEVK